MPDAANSNIKCKTVLITEYGVTPTKLRKQREERGLSLRALSKQLTVSSSYWSKVERGEAVPGKVVLELAITTLWQDAAKRPWRRTK